MPGTRRTMKATWLKKQQPFLELLPSVERNWEKCCGYAPSTVLHCPPVPLWASLTRIILETEPWKFSRSSLGNQTRGRTGNGSENKQSSSWLSPPVLLLKIYSHIPTHTYFPNNQLYVSIIHTDKDSHPPMMRRHKVTTVIAKSISAHFKVWSCQVIQLSPLGSDVAPHGLVIYK